MDRKDAMYDLLKREEINWRTLISQKLKAVYQQYKLTGSRVRVFVSDDSIKARRGKEVEGVSVYSDYDTVAILQQDYGRYVARSSPVLSMNYRQRLLVQWAVLRWQLINAPMSFLSKAFDWIHLRCNWSANNGRLVIHFRYFELRN